MSKKDDVSDLFSGIDSPANLHTAKDAEDAASQISRAVSEKATIAANALGDQQSQIQDTQSLMERRVNAVVDDHKVFDLGVVLGGWFGASERVYAYAQITLRSNTSLNIDNAANYGVVPDHVVNQFVNSAATKATARARMEIARVLDNATGITRKITDDDNIAADAVAEKAQKLLQTWRNAAVLAATYEMLFRKTLNRISNYQNMLANVGKELAKKQVTLETISASLAARQDLVRKCLLETCIAGISLTRILDRETNALTMLTNQQASGADLPAQAYAQRLQEQEALVQILTKRLVDLKAFTIKLIGLYSVLGNTRFNVAVVKADVVFTRTNLLATLGLQLGLVVDILATLRVSEAARDIRDAEAQASEKVGVANEALNKAATLALTDVETTIRSLRATIEAAVIGIQNTHDNMQRVQEMNAQVENDFAELFKKLAV